MLHYPNIDPVIFSIGPLQIRWYGLMYIIGFTLAFMIVRSQARQKWPELLKHTDNLNLALIAGVILGGRLGYVFFYNFSYYLRHPIQIFATWNGGMSFHGGCIGVVLAGALYCRLTGLDFWKSSDLYVVTVPIGLGLVRIGNFINGELYGRVTDSPLGMVFPGAGPLPRHPSQLYEAFLEGVVLFAVLWSVKSRPWLPDPAKRWPHGSILSLFLILYAIFRIAVELVREPDPQLGFLFAGLTMGQLLSLIMLISGVLLWRWRKARS